MNRPADIRYLFEPRSVAVLGASTDRGKIGYRLVENIVNGGYAGKLFPVNPKGGEVLGHRIWRSLDEVSEEIDLAVIAVPAKAAYQAVEQCAKRGVKHVPIITSGFSEIGNTEEERRMVRLAREHGMRLLGPNIFGIFSARSSLNATFGPADIHHGSVAIVTQSGALGIAMIGKTAVENIGLSAIVSVGNKSDIDESDLLGYLVADEQTRIILMYIEGVQNGERLVATLKQAALKKPVVVVKSGRSQRGAIAAASHTGSLAGSDEVFDAIMRQCGVLRGESLEEAFNWCKFLAAAPAPEGENTVIVTNGGGIGVLATDASEKYGIKLYDDARLLKEIFGPVTPDFGSTKNPVDLTGQAGPQQYNAALAAALANDHIDATLGLYCETAVFDAQTLAGMIRSNAEAYRKAGKPIVFSILGGEMTESCIGDLRKESVPVFGEVYQAVSCLGALYRHRRHAAEYSDAVAEAEIDVSLVEKSVASARAAGRTFMLPREARHLMKAIGVAMPQNAVAHNFEEAVRAADKIGYPVVMKIVSPDIIHKSDAGGVALDLENKDEVIDAYQAIMVNARRYKPDARLEGVEISQMLVRTTETIVGARQDKSFGPTVMFGLGGIYVEVMKDVAFRAASLSRKEAQLMVKEIRSYPLLLGVRGEKRKDIDAVVDTIVRLATLVRHCRSISDIELNPLIVYDSGQGVMALDVRVLIGDAQ
ncbi:MAG: acetate--CoA ligase family protein [Deltaproteobacteria bacterium]|nr:acetate--CoA ligase family protein [Deltaproteobacteria bacterium]